MLKPGTNSRYPNSYAIPISVIANMQSNGETYFNSSDLIFAVRYIFGSVRVRVSCILDKAKTNECINNDYKMTNKCINYEQLHNEQIQ